MVNLNYLLKHNLVIQVQFINYPGCTIGNYLFCYDGSISTIDE